MKKRLLSLFLMICLCLSIVPAARAAETSGTCGENAAWSLDGEILTISGTGEMEDYASGLDVPWYNLRGQIKTAVIAPGITAAGDYSFAHLTGLTSLTLPEGVTRIGDWAFWHCEALPQIHLPGTVTAVGDYAFRNCYSLTHIGTAEENPAFYSDARGVLYSRDMTKLIKAPAGLAGSYAVAQSVKVLGADAFGDCGSLENVALPKGLTELGDDAFYNCASLQRADLPRSLRSIGAWAFGWCNSLRSITVPAGVESVGEYAFAFGNLEEITFTGNAPSFGYNVFCYVMLTAHYPADNGTWTEEVRGAFDDEVTWVPYVRNPFSDVPWGKYYCESVLWAYEKGITTGKTATLFAPGEDCTREQIVTFLWRASGCPEPASMECPFDDVKEDDYFRKAVLWAVEKGITTGATKTTFNPKAPCTRAQVVTFLHRAAGAPQAGSLDNPFADVSPDKYYYNAVLWAVENGITTGTSEAEFAPNNACTRGQIVTFLYRAYEY